MVAVGMVTMLIMPISLTCVQVKDQKDAFSMALHAFCSDPNRPICMIRGLCSLLSVDLDLFSSESLVQTCPDHEIEVRDQVRLNAASSYIARSLS